MNTLMSSSENRHEQGAGRWHSPFWTMVGKEVADHLRSWRFIVLLVLIALTFWGTTAVAMGHLREVVTKAKDTGQLFLYLKLLTTTEGTLPPFHVFLNFLGPLLGIGLGFDAINSEQQNGTLARVMAQPVYRDNLLLSKFTSSLILVGVLLLSLALLMIGGGMVMTGILIEAEEVMRILGFTVLCTVYVGFWLALSILLSVVFRQPSTSALTAMGIWLFFTVFYRIVIELAVSAFAPDTRELAPSEAIRFNGIILSLLRLAPSQLFTDATTTLLMPSVRSLGPVTMEQMAGAVPSPLSLKDSLMVVWPQVSGLVAATVLCFALTYYLFMRREVRS
ncbi:ABC transporter permease [Echinicola vietnamensis]|uniref:ABC-type transport system involved in multi-copper enzyme maturation, permease component n=1 Tax=Echinicola vietnamensis (strain DSM 17526 / LMG 23754 / KMM 6221) TaxID=926556 RepID=L0G6S7_ECHVK|nr:ABC transporter permease subunit [Echinicola vietnamensis]AGA80711.1 ABC-type transport system involved in multi-copper enzyme maturation, permease component [Echinicola vietnamensis DSM 17526]